MIITPHNTNKIKPPSMHSYRIINYIKIHYIKTRGFNIIPWPYLRVLWLPEKRRRAHCCSTSLASAEAEAEAMHEYSQPLSSSFPSQEFQLL